MFGLLSVAEKIKDQISKAKTAKSVLGESPVGPMHSEGGAPRKDGKMQKRQMS